jgi:hypothetical protein
MVTSSSVHPEGPRDGSYGSKAEVDTGSAVSIVLAAAGSLTVKLKKNGQPVAEFGIACHGPSWFADNVTSDDGSRTFARVAPGEYECEVNTDHETMTQPTTHKVTVPSSGAATELELDVASAGRR